MYLVCWFLAPITDAAAIRSTITTEARKRDEWRHLVVRGVDGPDLNQLEKLLRPKRPKGSSRIGGELLERSKMFDTPFTAVSRVSPEFLQALTNLGNEAINDLGRRWAGVINDVTEEAAIRLVGQMVEFARQASQTDQSVLELDVM